MLINMESNQTNQNNENNEAAQQIHNKQPSGAAPVCLNPIPQGQKPKKSYAALTAAVAAAFILFIALAFAVVFFKNALFGATPEKALARGVKNMAEEMMAYNSSLSEGIGFAMMEPSKTEQPSHVNLDFSITLPNVKELKNVGIEVDAVTDQINKKAQFDLKLGAYGFNMPVGSIVADGNVLYFDAPMLADDVYSVDFTNFGDDFNNSAWAEIMETKLPAGYSLELFSEPSTKLTKEDAELAAIAAKYAAKMREFRKVTAIREKEALDFGGREIRCGGVVITLPKDEANGWLEGLKAEIMDSRFYQNIVERALNRYGALGGTELEDYRNDIDDVMETIFAMRLEQDLTIHVYMDSKGRIVKISTPEDIAVSGTDVEFFSADIQFMGEARALDVIDGTICLKAEDADLSIGIDRAAELNETMYKEGWTVSLGISADQPTEDMAVRYQNEWNYDEKTFNWEAAIEVDGEDLTITADGGLTDFVKGESYTLRFDNAALSIDGEDLALLCGTITRGPSQKQIEAPSASVSLFDMTESEIEGLLYGAPSLYY